jgi:hypothetical protein
VDAGLQPAPAAAAAIFVSSAAMMCMTRKQKNGPIAYLRTVRPSARLLLWVAAASLILSASGWAQGKGIVNGRVVNGTDPSLIPAKVDVDAVALGGGMSVLKSATTDSSGGFRLEGLPVDQPIMIQTNYKSANYHGIVTFDASGRAEVDLRVFEPTRSAKGIRVEGVQMAFRLSGDRLQSLETITFRNETNPPRTFVSEDGTLRFSKAPGLLEPPSLDVTGPGSSMPLTQSPLESADGSSYYSLYPLRPGATTFEIQQILPYADRKYEYRKRFYQDVESYQLGVIPQDMAVSGPGLSKMQSDPQRNFAIFGGGPAKAGSELAWIFSGGTPPAEPASSEPAGGADNGSRVISTQNAVGRNALVIAPLLLMGFIVVLWYATIHLQAAAQPGDLRITQLKHRRDQLLNQMVDLDNRFENNDLEKRGYLRKRESGKRQLRRIALLLKK